MKFMLLPCYSGKSIFILLRSEEQPLKIKEIIVVEGKDDTTKIKLAVDADTIETNGSAINKKTLEQIRHAKEKRGVIIFTDPDYPGERIRHIVDQAVPGCKHAFLTKDKARAKHPANKSLGIEHATVEAIRQALQDVHELATIEETDITKEDLLNHQLIGGPGASQKREKLGELLQIGHTNGKQLLKRLTMFQITKEQFEEAMLKLEQEDHHG
jgi:ribonuclease M5